MTFAAACRRAASICASAVAATALLGPATASADATTAGCPVIPTVAPFTAWQDAADYFLAPGGDIEAGSAGWDLAGRAAAVEGNEPFHVGGAGDHLSLNLPAGSSATTDAFCIGAEHRTMRFFASAPAAGTLVVDAVYAERTARERSVRIATLRGTDGWAPSPIVPMVLNEMAGSYDNALAVSLRFSVRGEAAWQVDDVYVDPYRGG